MFGSCLRWFLGAVSVAFLSQQTFALTIQEMEELKWKYTGLDSKWIDNIFSVNYCGKSAEAVRGCFASADIIVRTLDSRTSLSAESTAGKIQILINSKFNSEAEELSYFDQKTGDQEKAFWAAERVRYNQLSKLDPKELAEVLVDFYKSLNLEKLSLKPFQIARILNASSIYTHDVFTKYEPSLRYNGLPQGFPRAVLGVGLTHRAKKYPTVSYVLKGSSAFASGIKWGDELLRIDGKDLSGADDPLTQKLLEKDEGQTVQLTLLRGGTQVVNTDVELKKATSQLLYSKNIKYRGKVFTYFAVQDFDVEESEIPQYCSSLEHFLKSASQSGHGLILDLRGNPGGNVGAAQCFLSQLIGPNKKIVKIRDLYNSNNFEVFKTENFNRIYKKPIVVLQDAQTASAAEIIAGTLKIYGTSINLGTRTSGKGIVQIHNQIGRLLHIQTVYANYLANGESPQLRGIEPQIHSFRSDEPNDLELNAVRMADVGLAPLNVPNVAPFADSRQTILSPPNACLSKLNIKSDYAAMPDKDPFKDLQVVTALATLSCMQKP